MVKEQKRWRLLKDLKKGKFCFLISVDNWSIELQKNEFQSLYTLLLRIYEQLSSIKDNLLEEESIESMDAFISVTENSETNIMSCLMASSKGVEKTIALVENMDYFHLSQAIGIDTLINKKLLTANTIFRYIRRGEVVDMRTLNNLNAEILEFVVKPESKVANHKIKDLDFPRMATIGGVIRDGRGVIALGDYNIMPGDRVVVCAMPRSIERVESLFL